MIKLENNDEGGLMKIIIIFLITALVLIAGCANQNIINNFEDCVLAGNQILETYPAQCVTKNGNVFVQEIINSYQDCVDKGYNIEGTNPQYCVTSRGILFIDPVKNLQEGEFNEGCVVDSDCVPLPSECHPKSCIHKKYIIDFIRPTDFPKICTLYIDPEAAYNEEDCLCQTYCVNKNLGS